MQTPPQSQGLLIISLMADGGTQEKTAYSGSLSWTNLERAVLMVRMLVAINSRVAVGKSFNISLLVNLGVSMLTRFLLRLERMALSARL